MYERRKGRDGGMKGTRPKAALNVRRRKSGKLDKRVNRPDKWNDITLQQFFRNSIAWLMDDNPEHLYFKTYCIRHFVFQSDIDKWVRRDKSWAEWYKRALEAEQEKVALMGAKQKINSTHSIFYLKAKHKWQEKDVKELSGAIVIQTDIRGLAE